MGPWFFVFLVWIFLNRWGAPGDGRVMGGGSMTRRSLLQAKKDCPVSFEHQNYTSITSNCKSPWPPNLCCPPFTDFVCNFSQYLNDESNNCAETMFSYLILIGSYPAGLFSSECRGDKEGLPCNVSSTDQTANGSSAQGAKGISEMYTLLMTLTVSALGMLLFY